jgi:heat shock protein HslJ
MTTRHPVGTAMYRSLLVTAAMALALTTASCTGSDNDPPTEDSIATTWGSEEEGQPHVTFADDGSVSGSDGCNQLAGNWSFSDDTIVTDNLATTLKACEGIDTWLSGFATAVVEGDQLIVSGPDGEEIGVLQR